ncbi:alanine racemase [Desulfurobacterium atlanticum]|uniref:Alanine racemase n=1 Tax=Desulfurobacterium atlanticum TaxID=240169 RepID=A0A238XMH7_9BACT|nr:alanine racemase [Desulfurobacterium atlanticum]SNR60137.1 alanine racemase [Desulfurobacterium atlanticum]
MLRWAEIYLNRLKNNYNSLKKFTGRKKIIAVVKANAYGHGSVPVSLFLERETDVDMFAVATIDEGKELREGGVKSPILVMSNPLIEGVDEVKELNLTPVVFDFESLEIAVKNGIGFHLKVDTGMGRLGFLPYQWESVLEKLDFSLLKGVMSHFADSDTDVEFTRYQYNMFIPLIKKVLSVKKVAVHIDNSGAVPLSLDGLLTHSRIGLALYGSKPYPDFPVPVEQVMEVKSKVIDVKTLPPDWGVSYGRTYITRKSEKIAVVAFGYADGFIRSLSNNWQVKINGCFAPVIGRICMDMTVVSVERIDTKVGDEVVITDRALTFDKMAEKAGTISYEIMCDISPRVKRIFFEREDGKILSRF